MITKIVEQIKTGAVTNAIAFGEAKLPSAPYVVVKVEQDIAGNGWTYRVIAHFKAGQQKFLNSYVVNDLMVLLHKFGATTLAGNYQMLYATGEMSGIIADNDDATIAMERVFLAPGYIL